MAYAAQSFHASTCRSKMCDKVSCFSSFYYAIMNFGTQLVPELMRCCICVYDDECNERERTIVVQTNCLDF